MYIARHNVDEILLYRKAIENDIRIQTQSQPAPKANQLFLSQGTPH